MLTVCLGQASSATSESAGVLAKSVADINTMLTVCLGQASSATSESTGVLAKSVAHIGWQVASGQLTSSSRDVSAASLAVSVCALSACAQDYHRRVRSFIEEHILPVEQDVLNWQSEPQTKWTTHPRIEQLKVAALSSVCRPVRQNTL